MMYSPANTEKTTVETSDRFPVRKLPSVSGKKTLYAEVHIKKKEKKRGQGDQQTETNKFTRSKHLLFH